MLYKFFLHKTNNDELNVIKVIVIKYKIISVINIILLKFFFCILTVLLILKKALNHFKVYNLVKVF
jgi:hypothetical protein